MGMLLRRHYAENTMVEKGVAEKVAPSPIVETVVENNSNSNYTKTEINRKSTSELRELAKELGIKDAELSTGSELKKMLIEKLGL